jgi:hypothetical protein
VPRGLIPRVNRVSYMTHPTVLTSTVATWIKDLNPKQLRAVARNATPLKTRVLDVVRRVLSGRGGATDPHGRTERSGVNSNRPSREGRGELNSLAGAVRPKQGSLGACPRGTSPSWPLNNAVARE